MTVRVGNNNNYNYNHGYWVVNHGYWVVNHGYWVVNHGYWVVNHGYWVVNRPVRYDKSSCSSRFCDDNLSDQHERQRTPHVTDAKRQYMPPCGDLCGSCAVAYVCANETSLLHIITHCGLHQQNYTWENRSDTNHTKQQG